MADQTITPVALTKNSFSELAGGDWEDLTAANAGICTLPDDGSYVLLFLDAAGGAVVTVEKGIDNMLGAQGDITSAALTINLTNALVCESSRVKHMSGDDKGKIRITTTANIKCACIKLPTPR